MEGVAKFMVPPAPDNVYGIWFLGSGHINPFLYEGEVAAGFYGSIIPTPLVHIDLVPFWKKLSVPMQRSSVNTRQNER